MESRSWTVAVLILAAAATKAMETSSMYVKKSDNEDMKTSGSGYSYQIRSGQPFTYTSYNTDSEGKFEDIPSAALGRYSHHPLPLHLLPLTPKFLRGHGEGKGDSYGRAVAVPYARGFDNFLDDKEYGSYADFAKGGGSSYEESRNSQNGEKGESGYSNVDDFAKGQKGQYGKDQHKGYYTVKGGSAQGKHELGNHYNNHHKAGKANRGGSFANEKGHDKGEKTTGYHKVFHKDEFKKDHSFYDKADKKGHFNRYGDLDFRQEAKEGASQNGGNHARGFEANDYGAKGFSDKGRYSDEDKGYKGRRGNDKFYKMYEDFARKGGKQKETAEGFSEGEKYRK